MKRQPYFDTLVGFSEGGERLLDKAMQDPSYFQNLNKDSITTESKIDLSNKPSEKRSSPEGLIQHLINENDALYEAKQENIELTHKIATMEIEHSGKVANYFVLGMGTGIALWEIIKLIVG